MVVVCVWASGGVWGFLGLLAVNWWGLWRGMVAYVRGGCKPLAAGREPGRRPARSADLDSPGGVVTGDAARVHALPKAPALAGSGDAARGMGAIACGAV